MRERVKVVCPKCKSVHSVEKVGDAIFFELEVERWEEEFKPTYTLWFKCPKCKYKESLSWIKEP